MTRGGKSRDRDAPERRCIASGASGDKAAMIRFVVGPGDMIVPDLLEKLPGRGIWVSAQRAAIDLAARKNLFSRAAKRSVKVPDDLSAQVVDGLQKRLIGLISLARKAGEAVAGLEKVKAALDSGQASMLIQASDGSAREKSRLRPPGGDETYFDGLSADQLGLAFARDRVIHAALIGGGLGGRVRYESARLTGLQDNSD